MKLKKYCSLNEPLAPPSADAPLSLMTRTMVLSVSPSSSTKSRTRATWASVWVRNPAYTSIIRAASRCSSALRVSQGGTHEGRSESCVPAGRSPEASWRAKTSSRQRSQPWSKCAAVALDVVRRGLVRGVAGAGGEPQEERRRGGRAPQIGQVADGVVGQVLGQVVALFGGAGRLDRLVVAHQLGVVLVGLTAHEAVVAVEAPPERPLVAGASGRHLGGRGQVPLAHGEGGVALDAEDLREEAVLLGDGGVVAREARRPAPPPGPCRSSGGCAR